MLENVSHGNYPTLEKGRSGIYPPEEERVAEMSDELTTNPIPGSSDEYECSENIFI